MRLGSWLIQRYIVAAIAPYLLMALLLLTAILLAQQSGRVAEILVVARVPATLLTEFSLAMIPNVLVFALPMATLVGTLVGLSRMGTDSELVALRAAGVGTWQMLWPVLLLGCMLASIALWVNMWVAPEAARTLRRAGLRAALYKLDSPVEPRTFNTEIPGYVIYVKDGDKERGQWGRVFLFAEKDGATRLVTARSGRIDSSTEQSELVLYDAVLTQFPSKTEKQGAYVTERFEQLRVVLQDTGRRELLAKLRADETRPEEMDWGDLLKDYAGASERLDRLAIMHRRLALSAGPLVFALLGASLGLRVRKGGRGLGVLLSLAVLIAYYLLSLLGEQMARAGTIHPFVGSWMASVLTVMWALLLLLSPYKSGWTSWWGYLYGRLTRRSAAMTAGANAYTAAKTYRSLGFPGLLDKTLIQTLVAGFALVLTALTAVILVFTLFELWRFIIERGTPARTVVQYLLYLLPFIGVQLAAPSMLVAVLASYALMARRSEAVAWWACGQSIYRLSLPGLFVALCAGAGLWAVQERLMPEANVRQDMLRAQIRSGAARAYTQTGRQWLASTETGRLYSYETDREGETPQELVAHEFDAEGVHLRRIIRGERALWASGQMTLEGVEVIGLEGTGAGRERLERLVLERGEAPELFKSWADKPSQLNAKGLSDYIKTVRRKGESSAPLILALQRKYAEPFGVIVMTLIGIPLALAFGRRSTVTALSSAVAVGLAFWGVTSGAQQLGNYGLLPPAVAAWAPTVIFAATGLYLLGRART